MIDQELVETIKQEFKFLNNQIDSLRTELAAVKSKTKQDVILEIATRFIESRFREGVAIINWPDSSTTDAIHVASDLYEKARSIQ